jgi:hypothetical protein
MPARGREAELLQHQDEEGARYAEARAAEDFDAMADRNSLGGGFRYANDAVSREATMDITERGCGARAPSLSALPGLWLPALPAVIA